MSQVIGRGRYARETYPQSPSAGGAGGAGAPLERQRFIDGNTTQAGLTGAIGAPFETIAQFMAARAAVAAQSIADAGVNFVGWVMPAEPVGYPEDVSFTPYASTGLWASAEGAVAGVTVVGNVRWDNVAGANTPAGAAVSMHNVGILGGSFVVTDDVGAPPSSIVITSDGGGIPIPSFDSSVTTRLGSVFFSRVSAGPINAGTASDSADVSVINSQVNGNVAGRSLAAEDTVFGGSVATVTVNDNANFIGCRFTVGGDPVLTAPNGAVFDGPSWQSFVEAGGTKAAGTVVLVPGGYNGAPVEGAALNAASVSVALNGVGTTAGFEGGGNHYTVPSGETTPTTVVLLTAGALDGDTMLISKQGLDANAIDVQDSATSTIGTIPANERGFVLARFSATTGDWVFDQGGSLAA